MNHIKEIAIKAVETVTGITFDEMNRRGLNGLILRNEEYVQARRLVYVLIRENSNLGLKSIAKLTFGHDHSSIINSLEKHQNYLLSNRKYVELWEMVEQEFKTRKKSYDLQNVMDSPEYRNHVQDILKNCIQEAERCIDILRGSLPVEKPTAQDLGFSVVNLNE